MIPSEVSTEPEPTTDTESTTEPEPSSSAEASTKTHDESVPSPTDPSEVSRESSVDTKDSGNNLPLIIVGLIAVIGAAGFILIRKRSSNKEEQ